MGLLGTTILRAQIENPAHPLDQKGRLIGCCSVQQHCHRRLKHLFYDAMTKRFDNVFLEFAKAQPFAVGHRPTRTNYAHEVSVPVNKSPDDLEALGKLLCAA
jgi:hypothetical protein